MECCDGRGVEIGSYQGSDSSEDRQVDQLWPPEIDPAACKDDIYSPSEKIWNA